MQEGFFLSRDLVKSICFSEKSSIGQRKQWASNKIVSCSNLMEGPGTGTTLQNRYGFLPFVKERAHKQQLHGA